MNAKEAIESIDSMLLREGYDSWRDLDDPDYQKVYDAFCSFFGDWQDTKTGELRDQINALGARLDGAH